MENYDFSFITFLGREIFSLCKIVFIPVTIHAFSGLIFKSYLSHLTHLRLLFNLHS
jgi:hypothetical protein